MTKDDVDAVIEVFTPDGTYSAFGDTYRLADFPSLVAAAPKGLFLVGPPAARPRRGHRHRPAAALLRRPDHPRHAHRVLHRHLPPDVRRVAPPHPGHDLPPQERGPRFRPGPRPNPPAADLPVTGAGRRRPTELDDFRRRLDAWLDDNRGALAADYEGTGTLDQQMAQLAKVKRLTFDAGWMRFGWPERVGGLGGSTLPARLPGRGADRPGPGRARALLDDRGAGAHHDRLRRARAGRRHGPRPPPRGRDVVPGVLRARHREQPRLAGLPGRAHRRGLAGHRAEGLDEPGPVRTALRPPHPDRDARVGPPGDHRPLRGHGLPRHHGAADRDHARRATSSREVFFDDVVVPFARTLGEEGAAGPWPWTCCPTSAAPRSGTAPRSSTAGSRSSSRPPRPVPSTRPGSARSPSCSTPSGPARGPPSTAWPPASASVRRPPSTRSCWPPSEQAVFDLVADALAADVTVGDDPASGRWRTEYLYSRAASIYGGSAEIQRNIIARRLLDLGDDR